MLGVTRGARLADLALGEGEAGFLAAQIARMFSSNSGDAVVVRSRAARSDRLMMLHLRLVRPDAAVYHPFCAGCANFKCTTLGVEAVIS